MNEKNNDRFFVIERRSWRRSNPNYSIMKDKHFDLTEATRNLLALEQLNDDKDITYFLEAVHGEPLKLEDEVKENGKTEEMPF
jgi:hypothetical protein